MTGDKTKNKIYRYPNWFRGFTLIELLVSSSIFAIVTLMAVAALMNLASLNDKAQSLLTAMNNLDFAMDHMARTLRLGKGFSCSPSCGGPTDNITFFDAQDRNGDGERDTVTYRFNSVEKRIDKIVNGGSPLAISAPEIAIDLLEFRVVTGQPRKQPRLGISVSGLTNIKGLHPSEQTAFNLQTVVSQRAVVD